jgi:hypothetical protein
MGGLAHDADPSTRRAERDAAGTWRWNDADTDGTAAATVTIGPSLVRCVYDPERTPVGPSTAPRACEFWSFIDRELGTALGPLTPAPELRR